jgi:hypothetical protein
MPETSYFVISSKDLDSVLNLYVWLVAMFRSAWQLGGQVKLIIN